MNTIHNQKNYLPIRLVGPIVKIRITGLLRFLFMALLCLVSSGLWSGTTMVSHYIECWVFSTRTSTLNARDFYFPVSSVIELFVSGNSFGELAQQVVKLLHGIEDLDC
jgi:hypothetical protein